MSDESRESDESRKRGESGEQSRASRADAERERAETRARWFALAELTGGALLIVAGIGAMLTWYGDALHLWPMLSGFGSLAVGGWLISRGIATATALAAPEADTDAEPGSDTDSEEDHHE